MNDSLIYLLNVPELDVNNNNSIDFVNLDKQFQFFSSRIQREVTGTKFIRKQVPDIKVKFNLDNLRLCNYVMINNDNKWYYYFILDKVYVSENVTRIILKLDVIQTYLFEFSFLECFIERQHCNRWDSNNLPIRANIIEEGLEVGEYEVKAKYTAYDFTNKGGYIIASGDCLGKTTQGSTGGSLGGSTGGSLGGSTGYKNGRVSKMMLVCLKGYEGYYDYAYDIGDGTMTIGYGTTLGGEPEAYQELVANCTEQKATEIMVRTLENNYSIGVLNAMHENGLTDDYITQNKYDAFVDLAYNCGVYGATSSPMFQAYCNKKSDDEVCAEWGTYYINEGTSNEQGLRNRRQKEINIFKNSTYQFDGITVNGNSTLTDNEGFGYIPPEYEEANTSLLNSIVNSARKLIGRPYVLGGNCPPLGESTGTDCSGLCQWAYHDNGIEIPRTTYDQINIGTEVTQDNLQIADLVFSYFSAENVPEHVFIISKIENGTYYCVEAQQEGTNILERIFIPNSEMRFRRVI